MVRMIGTMLALACAAWLSGTASAEACSCIGPIPACQRVWMSEAVFVGRVVDVERVENGQGASHRFLRDRRVTLEVLERFHGANLLGSKDGTSTVEVFTGQGGGDCGIGFVKGESYLVFARAPGAATGGSTSEGSTPTLQTGLCDGTRELSRAQQDLPYLRSLVTSPPRGGRVYGYVELADPQVASRLPLSALPERKRLPEVPITLTGEDGARVTKKTTTDASGNYEFTDLEPGKYRVDASLPDRYYLNGGLPPFMQELRDRRGCSEMNVRVAHDGRVSGRLLDSRGAPVAGLTITLLGVHDVDAPYPPYSYMRVQTAADGTFEMTRIPPGRYVAAINVERDPKTRELLKPRILYPGVHSAGDAKSFDVGPGERIKLSDWTMPRVGPTP
jgi:hypothetical protein